MRPNGGRDDWEPWKDCGQITLNAEDRAERMALAAICRGLRDGGRLTIEAKGEPPMVLVLFGDPKAVR